jgi:hypothetical protein
VGLDLSSVFEAEALWTKMELVDQQPPRRIPGTPAMVMSGRKPAR